MLPWVDRAVGAFSIPCLMGCVSLAVPYQVVLSCTQDDFFARNRFSNFGDLGVAVKGLMDDYQKATRLNENINSIEDMQAFLERQVHGCGRPLATRCEESRVCFDDDFLFRS